MHLVIFSDFDGTISVQDTGVVLIDHCIGRDRRIHLDEEIFKGSKSFREAVQEMWDGVNVTWPQALEMLQSVPLDDHFNPFCQFCHQMGFPIYVLSGGLEKLIVWMFEKHGVTADLEIMANSAKIEGNKWEVIFRDDSGHDKGESIRSAMSQLSEGKDDVKSVFIGDGISDISAAKKADFVFAKRGLNLERWCINENVPHQAFDSFQDVFAGIQKILQTPA